MSAVVLLLALYAFMVCTETNLPFSSSQKVLYLPIPENRGIMMSRHTINIDIFIKKQVNNTVKAVVDS
jgi:hypothetical protein